MDGDCGQWEQKEGEQGECGKEGHSAAGEIVLTEVEYNHQSKLISFGDVLRMIAFGCMFSQMVFECHFVMGFKKLREQYDFDAIHAKGSAQKLLYLDCPTSVKHGQPIWHVLNVN